MDLNEFLGPKPIVIDLRAENRWEAIDELIDQLVVHHKIKAEHQLVAPTVQCHPAQGWSGATTLGQQFKMIFNPNGVGSFRFRGDATPLGLGKNKTRYPG